jgi:hypothetical protein
VGLARRKAIAQEQGDVDAIVIGQLRKPWADDFEQVLAEQGI